MLCCIDKSNITELGQTCGELSTYIFNEKLKQNEYFTELSHL